MDNMDISNIKNIKNNKGIKRIVVGAIVVSDRNILFLRRHPNDFMGGIYELPSGAVQEGEDLIDALKREIAEETGLQIKNILSFVNSFDYKSKKGIMTRQFNFLVTVENADEVRLNPKEHDDYIWISFNDLSSTPLLDKLIKNTAEKAIELYIEMSLEKLS
ncbi:NUDIX hydrolase [bacterium]|nr:NUDIX hydrolase [bacterium]